MPRLFAIFLLTPAPLFAEPCPATTEDTERGIQVTLSDGSQIQSILDPTTGIVTEIWTLTDGAVLRSRLAHGLYPVDFEITDGGTLGTTISPTTYLFDTAPPALTEAGQSFASPYTATFEGEDIRGTYSVTTATAAPVTYGDCHYDAIPLTVRFEEPGYLSLQQLDLIPALGLTILRAEGESLTSLTLHNPVAIALKSAP